MTKTATETVTEALRMLGVVAIDEAATADDRTRCKDHLDSIYSTLTDTEALALDWTVETVPDGVFLALARAVAGSVASTYGRAQRAQEAAVMIDPRKSLYEIGMDGVRAYEGRKMHHQNTPTVATYF